MTAVYDARFDDAERAFAAARLEEAPIEVALHRYVEEIVRSAAAGRSTSPPTK